VAEAEEIASKLSEVANLKKLTLDKILKAAKPSKGGDAKSPV
jgi:hypothetical protein